MQECEESGYGVRYSATCLQRYHIIFRLCADPITCYIHVLPISMYACMSIMAPIALLIIPGRRDPSLCVPPQDFFLVNYFLALSGARVRGGDINIMPVKPSETVPVIKGYTNIIELNSIQS